MDKNRQIKTYDELINDIKAAGASIINNAESILGNEKYFINVKVSFVIDRNKNNIPTINVSREFIPEANIDVIKKENDELTEKVKKETKKTTKKKEVKDNDKNDVNKNTKRK